MADEILAGSENDSTAEQMNNGAGAPPDTVRAFDQAGNEVLVPRAEWAAQVLPNMVKEAWDTPEMLYNVILNSLNDGFAAEMSEAAQRLYETDTLPARGVCMWAIVLMQVNRVDEAGEVMARYTAEHGEDGSVLVNMARFYALKGEPEKAETTLWRALEVEPNLDNGLGWYATLQGERGGQPAARAALEKVAMMPESWRAQLWLAREELQAGNLGRAREFYHEALSRAPKPVSGDFLMQMSGDLGAGGHLYDLVALTAPEFVPEIHGLPVGNNLIKAYVDTGNFEAAEGIRTTLEGFGRPDWATAMNFWRDEVGRRRRAVAAPAGDAAATGAAAQQMQIGMLRVDGPVWLPPQSPARQIFGVKAAGPSVSFLGGSAEAPEDAAEAQASGEVIARLTRALPLWLAEQVEMRTAAQGRAVVPWAVPQAAGMPGGFVVSSTRWPDDVAVQMVSDPSVVSDYVVAVHLDAEVSPWTVDLAFIRTDNGTRIGELSAEFTMDDLASGLDGLGVEMVELLAAMGPATPNAAYEPPAGVLLPDYLMRLEQLLTLRCSGMDGAVALRPEALTAMLEGEARLCEGAPESVPARLVLVESLGALTRLAPAVAESFSPEFQRVMSENPLGVVDGVFGGVQAG